MKKQFQSKSVPRGTRTIWRYLSALILLFSLSIGQMWGAVYATYSVSDLTYTSATLTYEKSGLSGNDQKLNKGERKVEVPCASASGTLYLSGTGANAGRYASIWGSNGTAVDATRKIAMTSGYGSGISFTSDDILTDGEKYYIIFSNVDGSDYKINAFKYVLSAACPSGDDTTAPTLSSSNPANSATDVAVEGTIVLTFSEAIASVDDSKFTLTGATIGTVEIDGSDAKKVNVPYSSAANEATVTLSVAAEAVADAAGNKSAELSDISFTTVAAVTPACPSGILISGTAAYTEGQTISLTASLSEGNGEITYNWYKGADLATAKAAGSIGTGTSFSKVSCTTSDAGNYFCVASKDPCPVAESAAYAVTVEEKTCPTSGEVFYMEITSTASKVDIAAQTTVELGTYGTFRGGSASIRNNDTQTGKAYINNSSKTVSINGNNAYITLNLDCPLKTGDQLTFVSGSGSNQICFTTDLTRATTNITSSNKWTVPAAFNDVSTIYIWRNSSHTYIRSITITRPYNITFKSEYGVAPSATTGFEIALTQITGVEGWVHTGWRANKVVKVSGSDVAIGTAMAVDATATVSDDTHFTAVWEEDIPAVDPTITFNNGAYTIGGAALNLSSLFTSNSSGAVTYTVKTDGGTSASIDGTSFTATAAGTCVVTATQAAAIGYNAATADASIVVSAPAEVDGIKMVVDGDLTGNFRTSQTLTTLSGDNKYTIAGLNYTKYIKFGSSVSSWSAVAGPSNKYLVYTPTKKTTNFYFYVHNNSSSASYINLYLIEEGNATPTKVQVPVAASENALKTYELNITKNTEAYITAESNNVYFCQVVAVESGDALLQAPAVGYVMNLNKGRLSTASNTETTLEGLTFVLSSGYSITSGSNAQIGTKGTHYVSFTIPTGQTRQLQLTTSNTAKYTVSKTLGDDENQFTPTANEVKNWNLKAGTWYINPQGSNVSITNIAFAAAPDALTVTYKDGEDTYTTQNVWAGEKTTAPADPTKSGYRFVEWREAGESTAFDFANTTIDADLTLNAVWQQVWTVTFDSDGGSDVAAATVDDGDPVAQPANPTKTGFDFVEWQLNESAYNFSAAVTANITLVAVWEVAQTDASLSALSYNDVAIDVNSAVDVSGVQTYTVHLQWGSTIDAALISVTKSAESADISSIVYNSENKQATFMVTSGNGSVSINYAIQFVIDAKRGTSIIKATTNNVVTGLIGGTRTTNLGNGDTRKLNAKTYFGVTLAGEETFQEGDVFIVNITTPADLGKFMVYADAERTELVADQGIVYTKPEAAVPVLCPTGEMMMTLPAAANGKKSLYLSREDGTTQWNPTFSYVEVVREMNPAIKSFKFGEDAATINESAKTISIDVPYGTAVTALTPTVEAYGNNGATYTPTGAQDFTNPVNYVVTDGYSELSTTYAVTVNIAAPSENANLASLAVAGYSLDFDPAVVTYNVVLDYGTTELPAITYEVEEVGLATANKVEGGVNGATTITVTPQAGVGYEKVYTINFSVSTTPKFVIYDGSTMSDYAESGSDVSTGFAWTVVGGNHSEKSADVTLNGKTYAKGQNIFTSATAANTRYIEITIPEGYLAKFYLAGATNSKDETRSSFISKEITSTLDESIAYVSSDQYSGAVMESALQLPGTYYYCATKSIRLYELSIQLYPIDEERNMTQGRFGTICYPNGGYLVGAMLLEIAYFDPDQKKIFFDEVIGGKMVAGAPYLFLPNEGVDKFAITYTDALDAAAGHHNGLYGSYTQEELPTDGNHYIMLNNQYCKVVEANTYVGANRAYIRLDKIGNDYVAPAYGRRRVSMGVQQTEIATGIENLNIGDQPMKIMIDGQIYILRGEKMYDATGRLVK